MSTASARPVRASLLGAGLWVVAGLSLLTACAEPVALDYTQRAPLAVQPETVSVPARFVGNADPFAGAGAQTFATFVETYLDRGHGPVTIAARAPAARGSTAAPARIEQLKRRLLAAGVPASAIRTQLASEGERDTVTLSYERYTAVLPTCGDWSERMDFNPNNRDYQGFGCAQQHNLGAMVADPADLASMHPAAASDTANTERVLHDYRGVGTATPNPTESGKNALQGAADSNAASGSTVGGGAAGGTSR